MLTRKAGESWAAFRSACEKSALLGMCGEEKQGKGNAEPFRSGMFSFGLRDWSGSKGCRRSHWWTPPIQAKPWAAFTFTAFSPMYLAPSLFNNCIYMEYINLYKYLMWYKVYKARAPVIAGLLNSYYIMYRSWMSWREEKWGCWDCVDVCKAPPDVWECVS